MKLKVAPVGTNYVHQTWPLVKQFIEEALAKGYDFPDESRLYTAQHILQYVSSGQWVLLVALDEEAKIHGACVVSFINYPLHRVAFVTAYGGAFVSNEEVMGQFKNIMKSSGATKIQAFCRDSMVRLLSKFDFEPRNTLVEVML